MKIAVVNDVHSGKALKHKEGTRAASHLVEELFPSFLKALYQLHKPDLLVNLGDLIRGESKELDLYRYQNMLQVFLDFPSPILHLLGNHELKNLSVEDIETLWQKKGFHQKSYGYQEFKEYGILWLDLEDTSGKRSFKQIEWLKSLLQTLQKPFLVFSHCPIDHHNLKGNFFFESAGGKDTSPFFLENSQEIRELIASSPFSLAVIQAHLHHFHALIDQSIPYITCPAMGDNICGPQALEHVPEIYTLLELEQEKLTVKAYSREFCFAGVEYSLKK